MTRRRRLGALGMGLGAWAAILVGTLNAQNVLDQVIVKFNGEIVTSLDVRQARMLKLVQPASETDQGYVDAIVNRRLILSDLKRNPPPEPTTEAVEARFREWSGRLGVKDANELLARAGTNEAGLRGWLRDDLRIQAYIDGRFAGRSADLANWIDTLRQRAGLK